MSTALAGNHLFAGIMMKLEWEEATSLQNGDGGRTSRGEYSWLLYGMQPDLQVYSSSKLLCQGHALLTANIRMQHFP